MDAVSMTCEGVVCDGGDDREFQAPASLWNGREVKELKDETNIIPKPARLPPLERPDRRKKDNQ